MSPPLFTAYLPELPKTRNCSVESFPNARLAVQACEGWSRSSGRAGLCLVASSYGVLEGLSAALSAYGDTLPLLLVGIVRKREMADLLQSAQGITAESHAIRKNKDFSRLDTKEPARGPVLLLLALSEFRSNGEKSLELLLSYFHEKFIQKDFAKEQLRYPLEQQNSSVFGLRQADANKENKYKNRSFEKSPSREIFEKFPKSLNAWASGLAASKRPLLYVGAKALLCSPVEPILSVAQSLSAPILLDVDAATLPASVLGRLRDNFPSDLLLEPASFPAFWSLLRSDCVLSLDVLFGESEGFGLHDFRFRLKRLYRLSSGDLAHRPFVAKAEFRMRHEVAVVLQGLLLEWTETEMLAWKGPSRQAWQAKVRRLKKRYRKAVWNSPKLRPKEDGSLDPALLAKSVLEIAPKDALFLAEGNAAGMWFWSFADGQSVLYPNRMASIGVALGWMLGAGRFLKQSAVAEPYWRRNRYSALWAFLGDGSFLYDLSILKELKERGLGGNIVIFNNSAWSAIRIEQRYVFFGRFVKTEIPAQDLAALARMYGVEARRVESVLELEDALGYAARRENLLTEPLILDVQLPRDALPYAGLSFALAELDYILRPRFWSILGSLLWDMLRGRFPWRIVRILLRAYP